MHERSRQTPADKRWLWPIIGLSVAFRVGAAFYLGTEVAPLPGTADQVSYHALAQRVLDGHGFSFATGWWPATSPDQPTAHWSYLYVLWLAGVFAVVGPSVLVARVAQAVLGGVLQPLLTYRISRQLFGPRVGLVSALTVGAYPYFVYYSGTLMTETFFIVAMLWSTDTALKIARDERDPGSRGGWRLWVVLGLALGAAVLLRQAVLVCVPLVLAWVGWRVVAEAGGPRGGPSKGAAYLCGRMMVTVVLIAACVLPWTIRNWWAFHQFVLLNTNAGFAFYWGNHPVHGTAFIPILPGDGSLYGKLIPDDLSALDEAAMDKALLRRGLAFVADDPVRYGRLSLSRATEYLRFWPSPDSGILATAARVSFGVCLPFILLGIPLALRGQRHAGVWLVLSVAVVYSLVHVLTWTLVRYRLPVDALMIPFAALAWTRLVPLTSRR